FIVGLGGGSTIDAAKSIALMVRNPGLYWDYVTGGSGGGQSPAHAALPVVAIPTTAGTGSEADCGSVVTRSGRPEKISWGHPSMFPHLAIVDPDLTLSVPAATTAYTGMEAFFQAAEALLTPCRQPTSDMLALEAIQIISRFLPRAVADGTDREARTMLMWAGSAAGICGSLSSGLWLHPLAQALGAHAPDLPQGAALTHLSEAYFTWLGEQRPERFDLMAAAMGVPDDASGADGPEKFVAALNALIVETGLIRESLSRWGLKENRIAGVTHTALATRADLIEVTPVAMTPADVEAILATALRG
ncbi:MAG: iron-containing alcohol dehydrogenase, partial [Desulfosarcina sp.]|nr:iron-containing alcohol dehydrogenase [Desulfobacterales bacterium]